MSSNHSSSICKMAENWCHTEVQLQIITYVWKISNFDFHEAEGGRLSSHTFSTVKNQRTKWSLLLKPNGETDAKDYISLYVHLKHDGISESTHKKIYAKLTASVMGSQSQVTDGINDKEISEFSPGDKSWGWPQFLKKDDQFRNKLLCNNELTIICTIIFSPVRGAFTDILHSCNDVSLFPNVPACNIIENFGKLFENHEFADIVLFLKDKKKEFPVHKVILAARSSVFAAMFKHNLKETETNRIEIEDMNEEVVTEMLRYIYTEKCENIEKLADGLLAAADKYDLDVLKVICAETLYKTLSVDNAVNILALAELYCVPELKSKTIKFIVANFSEVLETTSWENILVSNPELINERCRAVADRLSALLI